MKSAIHLVSGDEAEHETALAIAENLMDDESGSIDEVTVVVQAGGIDAVTGNTGSRYGRSWTAASRSPPARTRST